MFLCLALSLVPVSAYAMDWQSLWRNDNQRAADEMEKKNYAGAAKTFDDDNWRAAALYRDGQYDKAAEAWGKQDDVEAQYNRGNALARAGKLQEAMAAYEDVLKRKPDHADARHNLEVIKKRMKDSKNQSGRQQDQQKNSENRKNDKQQQKQQQDQQSRQGRDQQQKDRQDKKGDQSQSRRQRDNREQQQSESNSRRKQEQSKDADKNKDQMKKQQQQAEQRPEEEGQKPQQADDDAKDTEQPEQRAATEQWLRRIPDDPGGLLRRKFRYQYGQRRRGDEPAEEPW